MKHNSYVKMEDLFHTVGKAVRNVTGIQNELTQSGLMIKNIVIETSLMPDHKIEGVKFASNKDLFLSGIEKIPYLRYKVDIKYLTKT